MASEAVLGPKIVPGERSKVRMCQSVLSRLSQAESVEVALSESSKARVFFPLQNCFSE